MTLTPKTGKVILAGAGPGDPELLTMKAARFLQNADVVLVDRLVSKEILTNYISPKAEIIYVGKQCRRGISTPQKTINELMIENALLGKLVVRLKGGDVSIFSNILDELESLVANNIEYEIIPGVTAALGAAAFAGIPLTARGYATSVRFLTYYKSDVVTDEYWKELANTEDTLVFYMSSETLSNVVEKLTAHHIHEDKLMAIIEQATTPFQNVQVMNLYDFKRKISAPNFISPTLIIIGRVVSLHENFKWLGNSSSKEFYFKPMSLIPNLQPEKITNVS
jgi:uroporphyrin-III C-methyltransferase/precorrin-2 dehydrogenase/sirohydrochlorin ferrochelatase/uroporphyrin-III C-methyltransferase